MKVLSKCFNVDPVRNQRVSLEKSIYDKLQWTALSVEHFIDTFRATYGWGCNLQPIYDQANVI